MRFDFGMGRPGSETGTLDQLLDVVGRPPARRRPRRSRRRTSSTTSSAAAAGRPSSPPTAASCTARPRRDPPLRDAAGDRARRSGTPGAPAAARRPARLPRRRATSTPTRAACRPAPAHLRTELARDEQRLGPQAGVGDRGGLPQRRCAVPRRRSRRSPSRPAAVYLLRTFLEHFTSGVRRTYAYELLDENAEPALPQVRAALRPAAPRLLAQAGLHRPAEPPRADGPGPGARRAACARCASASPGALGRPPARPAAGRRHRARRALAPGQRLEPDGAPGRAGRGAPVTVALPGAAAVRVSRPVAGTTSRATPARRPRARRAGRRPPRARGHPGRDDRRDRSSRAGRRSRRAGRSRSGSRRTRSTVPPSRPAAAPSGPRMMPACRPRPRRPPAPRRGARRRRRGLGLAARPRRRGRLPAVRLRRRLPRVGRHRHAPVVLRHALRPVGPRSSPACASSASTTSAAASSRPATPAGRPARPPPTATRTRRASAPTSSSTCTARPPGCVDPCLAGMKSELPAGSVESAGVAQRARPLRRGELEARPADLGSRAVHQGQGGSRRCARCGSSARRSSRPTRR